MSLFFTRTQDQALLSLIIKIAGQTRRYTQGFGRTAMQKIPYFLNTQNIPMSYSFDIYTYGPFCQNILSDIDWLLADGVIKDESQVGDKSNYVIGNHVDDLLSLHRDMINLYQARIQNVVEKLAPLSPKQLELLSTLDYVYRQQKASGQKQNLKETVISRFKLIKSRFRDEEINKAYNEIIDSDFFA